MRFGSALKALEGGARVCRRGWNGRGMFLVQVPGESWTVLHNTTTAIHLIFAGGDVKMAPFIAMKTAQNTFAPWVPSQADMQASDWEVADEVRFVGSAYNLYE